MKKRLYILVEGEDDVRFFGRILKPLFVSRYDSVEIIPYASIKRVKVNNFLISMAQMKNDYIFVADIDTEWEIDFSHAPTPSAHSSASASASAMVPSSLNRRFAS
jgi:hypothetical protein